MSEVNMRNVDFTVSEHSEAKEANLSGLEDISGGLVRALSLSAGAGRGSEGRRGGGRISGLH